jgi:hypothetical protein
MGDGEGEGEGAGAVMQSRAPARRTTSAGGSASYLPVKEILSALVNAGGLWYNFEGENGKG